MASEHECTAHILEMDNDGNWTEYFPDDEYSGPNAKYHLEVGDPNTGPNIRKKEKNGNGNAALPAGPSTKENG
jgi:hypothetical protein